MGNTSLKSRKIFARGVDRSANIHVVGNASTGKTSLVNSFMKTDTCEYMHFKEVEVNNKKMSLTIFDCDSSEELGNKTLSGSMGAIICFSLDNKDGCFERVKEYWIPELKKKYPQVPLLLVGTKRDQRDDARKIDGFVREAYGRTLANKHKLKGYIECSTVTGVNVEEVFYSFINN